MTISEVVDTFDLTRTAVRKHLTILEEGCLITVSPRGKERVSQLNPAGLGTATEWLSYFDQFWDEKLNTLKIAVEKNQQSKPKRKQK